MQCEAPDTHFYADIRDFNLEFLGLVASARHAGQGCLLGLDSGVVQQVSRLPALQLQAMATIPCLLAAFGVGPRTGLRVAEPPPGEDPRWVERLRLFTTGLLTYLWQMSRSDALRVALVLGPTAPPHAPEAPMRDIRNHAEQAARHLEARFRTSPRFWPDLVRAARDGQPQRLHLARLTAIQLASAEKPRWQGCRAPALSVTSRSAVTR